VDLKIPVIVLINKIDLSAQDLVEAEMAEMETDPAKRRSDPDIRASLLQYRQQCLIQSLKTSRKSSILPQKRN